MKGTLVVGSLPRIVIPVARNLRARGIPVHGASLGPGARVMRSRVFSSFTSLGGGEHDPETLWEQLKQVLLARDIDTLIPCGDEVLKTLAPHDAKLRKLVSYCAPQPTACAAILNKEETLTLASSLAIPVPAAYAIGDAAILVKMRPAIRFPVVVKPVRKEAEEATGIKSEIVRDFDSLHAFFEKFPKFGHDFLIQDFIPGYGVAVEVLMHNGRPLVSFQHRREREYPVRGGVSVAAISEPPDPELLSAAIKLLGALDWEGVAMVEFRKDDSSGRIGLMEVNGRFWGSVALSLACGVDFPFYVWQLAHAGVPAPPATYPAGIRFRWLAGDVKRVYECLTSAGNRVHALARFFNDFHSANDAIWSLRDPVPALEEFARATAAAGLMGMGAVAFWLVPGPVYRRIKQLRHSGLSRSVAYLRCRFISRPGTDIPSAGRVSSVAFICHGNLIRSVIAEAVFRTAGTGIRVESAGTAATPGREADARAVQISKEFGFSLDGHVTRRVSAETVARADFLFVMDYLNYVALVADFPEAAGKTLLLGSRESNALEIDDPYCGTLNDVRETFRLVERCTRKLLMLPAFSGLTTSVD